MLNIGFIVSGFIIGSLLLIPPFGLKITHLGPLAHFHVSWIIGTGDSISVLEDPWLNGLPLNLTPTFIIMDINCESWKITNLINANR